jgi:hypothetical protein
MNQPLPDTISQPEVAPASRPTRRRSLVLIPGGAIVVLLIVAGALFGSGVFSGPGSFTAHGSEMVFADPFNGQNVQQAYPDITDGAQVTVINSSGTVVGTGTLQSDPVGTLQAIKAAVTGTPGLSASDFASFVMKYTFTVTVPGGLPRYGIRAGQDRGTVWLSPNQMRHGPALTLGSLSG